MRLNTALIVLSMAAMSAGCSPYLYKGEIDKFSRGVNQLAEASAISVRNTNEAIANNYRWSWLDNRPLSFDLMEGCPETDTAKTEDSDKKTGGIAGSPSPASESAAKTGDTNKEEKSCGLSYVNKKGEEVEEAEPFNIPQLKPTIKVLQDYADALAAVTNAADREALDKAQAELKQSMVGFATEAAKSSGEAAKSSGQSVATQVGPLADLFNNVTAWMLDTRRHQALQAAVKRAKEPVEKVGEALGKAMSEIQSIQVQALRGTTIQLKLKLGGKEGHELDEGSYATRLDALQATVSALEALRSANPKEAAKNMVEAHNQLAVALEKNQRQTDAVIEAMNKFLDSTKALHEASATAAKSQKVSQ